VAIARSETFYYSLWQATGRRVKRGGENQTACDGPISASLAYQSALGSVYATTPG